MALGGRVFVLAHHRRTAERLSLSEKRTKEKLTHNWATQEWSIQREKASLRNQTQKRSHRACRYVSLRQHRSGFSSHAKTSVWRETKTSMSGTITNQKQVLFFKAVFNPALFVRRFWRLRGVFRFSITDFLSNSRNFTILRIVFKFYIFI